MEDKKGKTCSSGKKEKPGIANDQIGENAGEGRFEKAQKSGKSR
jgi:hypothetical protein